MIVVGGGEDQKEHLIKVVRIDILKEGLYMKWNCYALDLVTNLGWLGQCILLGWVEQKACWK